MWESTYLIYSANPVLTLFLFLPYLIWIELRKAREARGWTTEETADQLNVDVRTYSGWERGEHEPRGLNRLTLQRTFPELNRSREDEIRAVAERQFLDLAKRQFPGVKAILENIAKDADPETRDGLFDMGERFRAFLMTFEGSAKTHISEVASREWPLTEPK